MGTMTQSFLKIFFLTIILLDIKKVLCENFVNRFEYIHQALLFSKTEIQKDITRAAKVNDKISILAGMTVEEKHIWNMLQREEQAFLDWRGFSSKMNRLC